MNYVALLLSVITGFVFVIFIQPKTKTIQLFLSFSGAYLLSITVLHLIPEVYESQQNNIGVFILLGILLQTVLEYFSKGAEHGHIHTHDFAEKIPWLLFISLSLHAFLEGLPLGLEKNNQLLWAIVIHKIPITVVLIVFLQKSNLPKVLIYMFVAIFALMSPLGNLLSNKIVLLTNYQTEINALIIGIFLHISTAILFESSQNHKFNFFKFIAIIIGFLVAFLTAQNHF
jgi:zinc and cadmium transporter